jgi:hypothetical protein
LLDVARGISKDAAKFLEWRMFFVGEPASTLPEHALAEAYIKVAG